jgi:hypothetical protein
VTVIRVPESVLTRTGTISEKELQLQGLEKYGDCSEIIPQLFLGSVFNGRDPNTLQKFAITLIINVAEEFDYGSTVEYPNDDPQLPAIIVPVHRIIIPDNIHLKDEIDESRSLNKNSIGLLELKARLEAIFVLIRMYLN